jgi:heme-degrading monooxygenase HmoA
VSAAVASFHIVRERPWRGPLALARLALDRPGLHQVPGLRFFRLLGTGRGTTTSASVDPRRTAMFAVWDDETALEAFLAHGAIARRWRSAEEVYTVRLRALRGHGTWRGVALLEGLSAGRAGGPVAVLTRADVRLRRWLPFLGAGPAVSNAVQQAPGLLAVVGVGEAPLGRQATFSLWSSAAHVEAFAGHPAHRRVVERTRAEGWYGEELFARFEPYGSEGTWDGRDPLTGFRPSG